MASPQNQMKLKPLLKGNKSYYPVTPLLKKSDFSKSFKYHSYSQDAAEVKKERLQKRREERAIIKTKKRKALQILQQHQNKNSSLQITIYSNSNSKSNSKSNNNNNNNNNVSLLNVNNLLKLPLNQDTLSAGNIMIHNNVANSSDYYHDNNNNINNNNNIITTSFANSNFNV
eukprot:Pgem_evm1s17774